MTKKIAVINLIGRTDMNVLSENPFTIAEELINKLKNEAEKSIHGKQIHFCQQAKQVSFPSSSPLFADNYA